MTPLPAILLAGIDPDLIRAVVVLAILIIGGIARLVGRRGPMRPPVRPLPPARPAPPDVADEIDEFLRRAAQQRNQAGQPQAAPQPQAVGPVRPQPARVEMVQAQPVRAEIVADRPVGGQVAEHVKKYLDAEKFDSRAGELGQEVVQTVNREIDQHLRTVFDHSVSRLAAVPGEAAGLVGEGPLASAASTASEGSEEVVPTNAMDIVALFSSADLVRQAIVLNEVFRRPEERWG
jgi:hypothetical protein